MNFQKKEIGKYRAWHPEKKLFRSSQLLEINRNFPFCFKIKQGKFSYLIKVKPVILKASYVVYARVVAVVLRDSKVGDTHFADHVSLP